MLPLASWVMRGRGQALGFVIIALLTSPIIWPNSILAAAALGLVTLRAGEKFGVKLWFFALLPTLAFVLWLGNFMPMLLITVVLVGSVVLRQTVSWSYALMSLTAAGLFASLMLDWVAQDSLNVYVELIEKLLTDLKQQLADPEVQKALPDTISTTFIAGMFGVVLNVCSFFALTLARYWQAGLYNPGGFRQEFHNLRLGRVWLAITLLLLVLFFQLGNQYLTWVWIVLFPMLIAGVALFHAVAMYKKLGKHWYVIFYCVLLLGDLPKLILVALALADSLWDIRSKLPQRKTD